MFLIIILLLIYFLMCFFFLSLHLYLLLDFLISNIKHFQNLSLIMNWHYLILVDHNFKSSILILLVLHLLLYSNLLDFKCLVYFLIFDSLWSRWFFHILKFLIFFFFLNYHVTVIITFSIHLVIILVCYFLLLIHEFFPLIFSNLDF